MVRTSRDELTTIRANISEIQKKLDLYNKNKCPHCLSDLTDEIHSQIKDKLLKLKESQESSIPTISQTIKSNESGFSLIEADQNKAKDKFYKIDAQVSTVKREIQQLSQQGKQTSDKHLVEVIKNIETELSTAGTSLAGQTEKLKVSQEMEMILSDNGMKRMLMSQIIPLLNKM
jgi:hypothetical protein